MPFIRAHLIALIFLSVSKKSVHAAAISWSSGVVSGDEIVSNGGVLVEACNFGNALTTSPVINRVLFMAIDFAASESPNHLVGLDYNTGEGGKLPGAGVNELWIRLSIGAGRILKARCSPDWRLARNTKFSFSTTTTRLTEW